ncbi:E3 ubiquitin-protein ligase RNF182-like [Thrips palmi]|uniref:E3 ubiquitin-protein ligase RNF182-like n=1 Tax=Thrips palmi TaxID=161013 RepID=A0A6P9A4I0_THRPL|nr:E3 ubiquitin-protein ligase RNF182-like [Thrips palmi]
MSLRCNICDERFDNGERRPKSLPCGHTECLKCLKRLEETSDPLLCPECRQELVGPVDALPDNYFALSFIVEREQQQKRADLR